MNMDKQIPLTPFFISLNEALSMFNREVTRHNLRVAYIVSLISDAVELSTEDRRDLIITALVHDIGAFTDEMKENVMYDLEPNLQVHSTNGSIMLFNIGLKRISKLVEHHHDRLKSISGLDPSIGYLVGLLKLADFIDRRSILHYRTRWRVELILSEIDAVVGDEYTQDHYRITKEIISQKAYWDKVKMINAQKLRYSVECPDAKEDLSLNANSLSKIIMTLVDHKSKHTYNHTMKVAKTAEILGSVMGLPADECEVLRVAGQFHDIGKLAIPNSLLDKRGKLDLEQRLIMDTHVQVTFGFLHRLGFHELAVIAGFHHERLDGSGYHFGYDEKALPQLARIIAVADVFGAVIEDRPYRAALSDESIKNMLIKQADQNKLDRNIVQCLIDNYSEIKGYALKLEGYLLEVCQVRQ